jgi:hypothetical protein
MKTLLGVMMGLLVAGSAFAQDEKKQEGGGLLGLPATKDLKDKIGWDDEQVKKGDKVYEDYKDKASEAQKKVKDAANKDDKKAAGKDLKTLREEISGKLRDICKDDEQKKKYDELAAPKKKK